MPAASDAAGSGSTSGGSGGIGASAGCGAALPVVRAVLVGRVARADTSAEGTGRFRNGNTPVQALPKQSTTDTTDIRRPIPRSRSARDIFVQSARPSRMGFAREVPVDIVAIAARYATVRCCTRSLTRLS